MPAGASARHVWLRLYGRKGWYCVPKTVAHEGRTMLPRLGVMLTVSRPVARNDQPDLESLFPTLKYRPTCTTKPLESRAAAGATQGPLRVMARDPERPGARVR